jgi:predicted porin
MKKKLLAVAVVGAFALPGAALAQSSVTISGVITGGYEGLSYGQYSRAGNSSQQGVVDNGSRLIFGVREDLGGGLTAIGQIDFRFSIDQGGVGGVGPAPFLSAPYGNTHVGLQSKNWGRLIFGRQDLHYFGRESDLSVRGSLRADSVSILSYVGATAAGVGVVAAPVAIAGTTRTPNVVHYTSPNWGGFSFVAAYSSNPAGQEGDIGAAARKGRAWNFAPTFAAKDWTIGYSYWSSKPDAPVAATTNQRADRLFGSYKWGGFKVGLAWDRSKLTTDATGVTANNRTAWSLPASYTWGPNSIHAHYSVARDDKAAAFAGLQTGAKMWAASYAYDLSKRTSVALTYAQIKNDANAVYNLFANVAPPATLGLGAAGIAQGEDPRLWSVSLRHAF